MQCYEYSANGQRCGQCDACSDSVRDVMFERMDKLLRKAMPTLGMDQLAQLLIDVADEAFSVCGISDKEQKEEW